MRDISGTKERIAWFSVKPFVPYLEDKLAFEDIPPFILLVMQMPGRPSLLDERDLHGKEIAALRSRDFVGN